MTILCIAGKNLIAVEALAALSKTYEVWAIPNPEDDGSPTWQPSFRAAAIDLAVPIVTLEDVYPRDDVIFLSLEYARIIRPERFATRKLFNIHFSLLPKYRGCNTSVWPILNGETEHGVTLHEIDAGIDTGAIIDQRTFGLADMTAHDAYMVCQRLGLELALEWVPRLMDGDYVAHVQGEGTTYPRSALDFGWRDLDLSEPAEQVVRKARAFTFPAYQRPRLNGRTVLEASTEPSAGAEVVMAADGPVFLRFD